jgi:hypothetical protein
MVLACLIAGQLPTPAGASENANFAVRSIDLYLPDFEMKSRGLSSVELTSYVERLSDAANHALRRASSGAGVSGFIVVGLKPPMQSRFWFMFQDPRAKARLQGMLTPTLQAVDPVGRSAKCVRNSSRRLGRRRTAHHDRSDSRRMEGRNPEWWISAGCPARCSLAGLILGEVTYLVAGVSTIREIIATFSEEQ